MRISAAKVAASVVLISGVAVVGAKGPTVKLTISGGDLPAPVEVTSQSALVHVWSGEFIGAPVARPRAALPRYQVAFHVLPNGRREPQVLYVVTYARDPVSGEAFIYLPGGGEEHHALNASTIHRDSSNGLWHSAAPRWAQALNRSLPR